MLDKGSLSINIEIIDTKMAFISGLAFRPATIAHFFRTAGSRHFATTSSISSATTTTASSSVPPFLHEAAFVNNELVQAADGATFPVLNPVDGQAVGCVPDMKVGDVEKAITSAHGAFVTWRETPAKERSQLLKNWYRLLCENAEDLARLMTLEQVSCW